ncbi:hypothetical protein Hdeb2414_s0016g00487421 [Helianthus debilis subsp. tardiflorus]
MAAKSQKGERERTMRGRIVAEWNGSRDSSVTGNDNRIGNGGGDGGLLLSWARWILVRVSGQRRCCASCYRSDSRVSAPRVQEWSTSSVYG